MTVVRALVEPLLSTVEVAELLGVSAETVRRWRHERIELPFTRVGGVPRYWREDVERYLARRMVSPRRVRI